MAAQSGLSIVVKIKDNAGTPAFQTIGGMRSRKIALNSETVDITSASSTNRYRELLDTAGVNSLTISGDGVFTDDNAQNEVLEAHMAGSQRDWSFTVPGLGEFVCKGKITQLEFSGDFNREVTFSLTVESAGDVTFTTA